MIERSLSLVKAGLALCTGKCTGKVDTKLLGISKIVFDLQLDLAKALEIQAA